MPVMPDTNTNTNTNTRTRTRTRTEGTPVGVAARSSVAMLMAMLMALWKTLWKTLLLTTLLAGCVAPWPQQPAPTQASSGVDVPETERPNPDKYPRRGNKTPYQVFGKTYTVMPTSLGYREIGVASWYGKKFHGRLTSSGEVYDMHQISAAHKALPLPSVVRVTNLDNGKWVDVRVNDRGPFHGNRIIDLSYATAVKLGFANQGTATVVVEAIDKVNYPEDGVVTALPTTYYLQVGAFSRREGAEYRLAEISRLIGIHSWDVQARILESENNLGVLHKVWVGPIASEVTGEQIAQQLVQSQLGTPHRVKVD